MASALAQVEAMDAARRRPLMSDAPGEPKPSRADPDGSPKEDFFDVHKLREQYIDYLQSKVDEIDEQQNARRYFHGAQWTAKQIEILRRRHQPAMTWNRTSRKINGIVGLVQRMRSDPKAFPRTMRSESGAEIATQVIRNVLDANDWKGVDPWCLMQCAIDGVAGVQMVLTQGDQQDPDIALPWVIGDEYFYDPKSYKLDFSDVRYEGIAKWLDVDEAIELFPDKEDELRGLVAGDSDMTTNPDREFKWVITATRRIRLVEHWYKHKGEWRWAFYVSNRLLDEGLSPFFDEKGKRCRAFHMFSMAVDQDGDRYGFVRNLKGPQDSLNQSKAKTLHIANSRRLILEKGSVDDVERTRIEWARPDGVVEVNPGKTITPDDKSQDLAAFAKFEEDAKNEIEQFASFNTAVLSGAMINNVSGRAIELLRQPGMAELGPFVLANRQWKLGLYRGIWNAAQRYWKKERWLRLMDTDEEKAAFMKINDLGLDEYGRPVLVNALGALDVDIILEEGPDIASVMQETYDALKGYPPGTFPPQVLIELSNMPRSMKNRILQMMAPKPPAPDPAAQMAQKLQLEALAIKNAKTAAEARKTDAGVEQVLATAEVQRAKVGESVARAGHLASQSHLDAAAFARDSYLEAHKIYQQSQQPAPTSAPKTGP